MTLNNPTLQSGQTHSNNSSAKADELFECIWPFCGVGAFQSLKGRFLGNPFNKYPANDKNQPEK